MSATAPARRAGPPPAWAAFLALAGTTALLALAAPALARPAYVAGCAALGWLAWREGAAASASTAVLLFAVSPLLRRLADLGAGYDPAGLMLLGPLAALLVPAAELRALLRRGAAWPEGGAPLVLMGLCATYGVAVSLVLGQLLPALTAAVKLAAPMLFGVWVQRRAAAGEGEAIAAAVGRAFLLALPAMGLYGLFQYLDPQPWDRAWMLHSGMDSIGVPEPFQVRVFATMNSPTSFAACAACGLLLAGFGRAGWLRALVALPALVGLLLSQVRAAWIGLAVGLLWCALFPRTRARAGWLALAVPAAILVAVSSPDLSEVVTRRLETLGGSVGEDGSGAARLGQFVAIYAAADELLPGLGLAVVAAGPPGLRVLDGELAVAWVRMGLVAGTVYLLALAWAGGQALARVARRPEAGPVVLGAALAALLAQAPLITVASAETGFLFWLFRALLLAGPAPQRRA